MSGHIDVSSIKEAHQPRTSLRPLHPHYPALALASARGNAFYLQKDMYRKSPRSDDLEQ